MKHGERLFCNTHKCLLSSSPHSVISHRAWENLYLFANCSKVNSANDERMIFILFLFSIMLFQFFQKKDAAFSRQFMWNVKVFFSCKSRKIFWNTILPANTMIQASTREGILIHFQGWQLSKFSWKGGHSKGKNLLPLGVNSFRLG